jgi:hypothetical protein
MSLCLRFLLSEQTTERINHHTLHPHSHWWSHQRSNEHTFRGIHLPDALPRRMPNWTLIEGDFLGLSPPLNGNQASSPLLDRGGYDFIVTLYFIDTASNIISYASPFILLGIYLMLICRSCLRYTIYFVQVANG